MKTLLFLLLFLPSLMLSAQVTFPVDKNLSLPPEREIYQKVNGEWVTVGTTRTCRKMNDQGCLNQLKEIYKSTKYPTQCYAYSFEADSLCIVEKDVMFKFFVKAFAEHRPIVLSPDIVWMMIGQGFSHYVNKNAEQLRDKLVYHQGKMTLQVCAEEDMLQRKANWEPVLSDFFDSISKNSKDDIASLITADFSTTGRIERMASQKLLMDVMKSYFEYEVIRIVCGIPSITLEGTPEDWQKVLDKTRQLEKYGLDWWVKDLTPILQEFVNASKGDIHTRFWQDIVMKFHPDQMTNGIRGCGGTPKIEPTTQLDGWFLKFFPFNQKGRTPSTVPYTFDKMLPEVVKVPFKYIVMDGISSQTYLMEFWSGFVGVEEDEKTYALRPKIGWMVMEAESDDPLILSLTRNNNPEIKDVKEFPEVARRVGALESLQIQFVDSIQVPDWIDDVQVESLKLKGKYNEATVGHLRELLPDRLIFEFPDMIIVDK